MTKYDKLQILTTIRDFISQTEAEIAPDGVKYIEDDFDRGRLQGLEDVRDYLDDLEVDLMLEIDRQEEN